MNLEHDRPNQQCYLTVSLVDAAWCPLRVDALLHPHLLGCFLRRLLPLHRHLHPHASLPAFSQAHNANGLGSKLWARSWLAAPEDLREAEDKNSRTLSAALRTGQERSEYNAVY